MAVQRWEALKRVRPTLPRHIRHAEDGRPSTRQKPISDTVSLTTYTGLGEKVPRVELQSSLGKTALP